VALPLVQLASTQRTWTELPSAWAAGQSAFWNSFLFAAVSATLCMIVSCVGWRLPIGMALWLPFLIPGVILGIALIWLFNRPIFSAFYQSAGIVIVAYMVRYLAFGWNGVAHAMRLVDPDLTDAARLEGASRWQLMRYVHWPQVAPQLAAFWYITFLLCLWDVESIVLIVPPGGETVALRVFNLLHYGRNPQVNALCLALLALAIAPLVIWVIGRAALQLTRLNRSVSFALCVVAIVSLTGCSKDTSTDRAIESSVFSRVQIIGTRGAGVGQFNKPRSVALDRQDNLYVVDMTGRVQKFSPDGKFILSWQMPQTELGKPKGMSLDKDGNVLVLEPHYQRVNHFSTEGKLMTQWGAKGTNEGQLILPRSLAVDSHGDIFTSEYTLVDRVQEFTPTGKFLKAFGHSGTGRGEFNRPEGMCTDSADQLYVADSCNHRVQIFSADGRWLSEYGKAGAEKGDLSYPYDIRVDKTGRQYVCEFGNSRIQIFDAHGRSLEILGGPGGEPGQFRNPWSMAFDSHENLYVADSQNHRVQKFIRKTTVASMKGGG